MIFAQRITQLDRVFTKSDCRARNQFRCARFGKPVGSQSRTERRFEIMRMIGCARRREPASVRPGNFVDAMCAHDLFDKIDVTLQIPPVTWDFPRRAVAEAALARRRFSLTLLPGRSFAKAGGLG